MRKTLGTVLIFSALLAGCPSGAFARGVPEPQKVRGKQDLGITRILQKAENALLRKDYEGASRLFAEAADSGRKGTLTSLALYKQGVCRMKMNSFSEARISFAEALPNADEETKENAMLRIADTYFLSGDYSMAYPAYLVFLEKYPDSNCKATAYHRVSTCSDRLGRPEEAELYRRRLSDECPMSFEAKGFSDGASGSGLVLQMGLFEMHENALKLARELEGLGFHTVTADIVKAGKVLKQVRIEADSASRLADIEGRLKKHGYKYKVIE